MPDADVLEALEPALFCARSCALFLLPLDSVDNSLVGATKASTVLFP